MDCHHFVSVKPVEVQNLIPNPALVLFPLLGFYTPKTYLIYGKHQKPPGVVRSRQICQSPQGLLTDV